MLPFIKELYNTLQTNLLLFNEEINDMYESLSLYQESLFELGNELSDLYNNFDSVCEEAVDENISAEELLTVLHFMEKYKVFDYLLTKQDKRTIFKPDHRKESSLQKIKMSGFCQNDSYEDDVPFI